MKKLKSRVGITGQSGFMGTQIYNILGLSLDKYDRVPFNDRFFDDEVLINKFVSSCDVIIHLAAINRHESPEVLYETNLRLVNQLIGACENTESHPHILFSSSTQESRDNYYGRSKKEGRRLLEEWADRNEATFTGFVIPNIFGPFGQPYYNSVVATFCHQLTHEDDPTVDVDSEIGLIYVDDLVSEILSVIEDEDTQKSTTNRISVKKIQPSRVIRVSKLLEKLKQFRELYILGGVIPDLSDPFDLNLFNTFVCYIEHSKFFPFQLKPHSDARGSFIETMKLNSGGQVSFSTTIPEITRGNHYHTRKAERFAVIKGKANIELRRIGTDKKQTFLLDGESPSFVDMPIWHTHNITNVGKEDLYTIFWINEHFNPADPDTYFEEV
jgi:UDP-2-acetamido-2,6-beta-L-arabino-hexul-4-ose reductase